jgi:hypothetical protein
VISATTSKGLTGKGVFDVAIVDPAVAFNRAWISNNTTEGITVFSDLLTDEWGQTDTFIERHQADQRQISNDNSILGSIFQSLTFARTAAEFEMNRLLGSDPSNPRLGQMRTLAGYVYLALAENFCSGVPLDDPNTGLTTSQLLSAATTRFGEAIGGPNSASYTGLARVGLARAQLYQGDRAGAAATAALVPPGFTFAATDLGDPAYTNIVYALNTQQHRLSVSSLEGTNGLPFRSSDPRVSWALGGLGFNAISQYYILLNYTSPTAPIMIATGTEARLIESEAALGNGDAGTFITILNSLRAGALAPVVDPGTPAARIDLLFSERAFWMFGTGHRLGDLRRLIAQYGRSASSVFPVGAYPIGGTYGTDANLPVPASARGASYSGCTDRSS